MYCFVWGYVRLTRWQRWTGEFFEKTSLQELGLRVQLLHPPGKRCTWSEKAPAKFVVLHTTGIHRVSVDFCGCVLHGKPKVERRVQLMRTAWWPASTIDPQTCATFALLKDFHLLSLQGKLSVFDYYHALELKSNSSGTEKVPVSLLLYSPSFALTSGILVPSPSAYAYGSRVAACKNASVGGGRPQLGSRGGHTFWFARRAMSCMPAARHESSRWVGAVRG